MHVVKGQGHIWPWKFKGQDLRPAAAAAAYEQVQNHKVTPGKTGDLKTTYYGDRDTMKSVTIMVALDGRLLRILA